MNYLQKIKTKLKYIICLCLFILGSNAIFSNDNVIQISREYDNLEWDAFVKKVKENKQIKIFYIDEEINNPVIKVSADSQNLFEVLKLNFSHLGFNISQTTQGDFMLTKKEAIVTKLPHDFFKVLSKSTTEEAESSQVIESEEDAFIETATEYIPETIIVGSYERGSLLQKVTLKGYAINNISREPVIGATIMDKDSKTGVATNHEGYFEITLSKGKHILILQSVNIKEKRIEVDLRSNGNIMVELEDKVVMLEDIVIRGKKDSKVANTQMGIETLNIKSVKKIPLVFGEKDVVKVALLLPGVKTLGEGSAGFNVRGSPTDQNLFYINNLPIYNTSHAAGFFSAFNPDAIEEFSLYKSNIPINYGGRLSSIFNITAKEGSTNRIKLNGGISPITGRLMVEGPIQKDKSSFLIGVRSTYSNWILSLMNVDEDIKNSKANFYDVVANFSVGINDRNKVKLFTYASNDEMRLAGLNTDYNYSNLGASIIWDHRFKKTENHFELSLAHSQYDFTEEVSEVDYLAHTYSNAIKHTEFKLNFDIRPNKNHNVVFGINSILYQIDRGTKEPLNSDSDISTLNLGEEKGLESAIYISDDWKINKKLNVFAGLRLNMFSSLGPQSVYKYHVGLPMIEENIQDTLNFGDNEFIKTNFNVDIRLAAKYMINDDLSIKASYNRLHQYVYMLSNTISVSPNFKWKLSDYNIKPSIGDQISAGIFSNVFSGRYELSVEAYYKHVQNLLEIKDGEDLFLNEHVETSTLQGDLDAYGFEFMFKKLYGKLTGWINYTYSKSTVKVDDEFEENQINGGESYLSNFDQPHAVNLVSSYDFSRRFSISGNVVYSTGRPITYPTGYYYWAGTRIINYSKRNKYRVPDYFRVDLSLTLEGSLKKKKLAHGSWTLSVYNLLGRKNAYSVFYRQENESIKAYKLSIFGAPLVSLTYNIKLGNYDN